MKPLTEHFFSPRNSKELFNLRHASARNVVERIFGILKQRFRILRTPTDYDMGIQALIPSGLAALHNFIRQYDPEEIHEYDDVDDIEIDLQLGQQESTGELGTGRVTAAETRRANVRRDQIASEMWDQYQDYLEHHVASASE